MRKKIWIALGLVLLFVLYTVMVKVVDVRPIGPEGSSVGLAGVNEWFHGVTGENMGLYEATDIISVLPLALVAGFALMGLVQWVRRRKLLKVDPEILAMGVFYILVGVAFVAFELIKINYRPVLIDGVLEASYPSSTTMLAICVLGAAMAVLPKYLKGWQRTVAVVICGVLLGFMVGGRLISGVHWLTDIVGGVLLSIALLYIYRVVAETLARKLRKDAKELL